MANEDGSLVMVFNGEIYNSPELRRYCEAKGHTFRSAMDGEVILHLWEMEGDACLRRLNGIFAVAVASTTTGEVVLARDPLGVKPLFYSESPDGTLWFASELTALRAAGAPVGAADPVALAQFLTFLWIPDPRTPFAGAKSLEARAGAALDRRRAPAVPLRRPARSRAGARSPVGRGAPEPGAPAVRRGGRAPAALRRAHRPHGLRGCRQRAALVGDEGHARPGLHDQLGRRGGLRGARGRPPGGRRARGAVRHPRQLPPGRRGRRHGASERRPLRRPGLRPDPSDRPFGQGARPQGAAVRPGRGRAVRRLPAPRHGVRRRPPPPRPARDGARAVPPPAARRQALQ